MGKKVYANRMEIAHAAGANKIVAAFPDVCLSPPGPPTGPVPVPYADTSMAGDLEEGSKDVKIGGKPVALHDKSYYVSSPLGNEAATKFFGGSVLTKQITGKTYFQACSMNVSFEGHKVNRHLDIATSNHGSQPPGTPPSPGLESMRPGDVGAGGTSATTCPCCGAPPHNGASSGTSMTSDEFYDPKYPSSARKPNKQERNKLEESPTVVEYTIESGCDQLVHTDPGNPCSTHYPASSTDNQKAREEFEAMMSPLTPDEYFVKKYGMRLGKEIQARGRRLRAELEAGAMSIAHRTPLIAGGCPVGEVNLQPVTPDCYPWEKELSKVHSIVGVYHRKVHGLR